MKCRGVFAVTIDNPDHAEIVAIDLQEWVREGGYIERVPTPVVPLDDAFVWCDCESQRCEEVRDVAEGAEAERGGSGEEHEGVGAERGCEAEGEPTLIETPPAA